MERETPLLTTARTIEILAEHRECIAALGVRRLSLFGSVLHATAGPDSDVDLLVDFVPERKTFRNLMALAFLLEDALGRRVELLTRESLSPHLGPSIEREARTVLDLD